jgi:hypothetical protein
VPQPCGEIGRADAEEFLPRIKRISVPCGEGSGCGNAFNVSQQQAAASQRKNSLDVAQPQRRTFDRRQAGRDRTGDRHTQRRQSEDRRHDDRQRHHAQCDRLARQTLCAGKQQENGDNTDSNNDELRLADLRSQKPKPLEEIMATALHAKQTWQLGHGDGQARADLEADEDAVADQFDQHAQPQGPGDQAQRRHREGGEAGDLHVALRIAVGHCAHRPGDHQRNRRCGPDCELART